MSGEKKDLGMGDHAPALDDLEVAAAIKEAMATRTPSTKPALARTASRSASGGGGGNEVSRPAAIDEEFGKQKAKELESEIQTRVRRIELEQAHLQQLQRMVSEMEGPQRHGIEQLRQEITRIQTELTSWHTTKRAADTEVEAATAELMQAQETKRRLSERLFDMLMDSEEGRLEKLASVEASLASLENTGGGSSGDC